MPSRQMDQLPPGAIAAFGLFANALEYAYDAAQRSILLLDVMRQPGNQYREHLAEAAPCVLDYEVEVVTDGRKLNRPVNYAPRSMALVLAASRRTAKSALRSRPGTRFISSAFFRSQYPDRPSKT
jgi:hypothetical protein